MTKLLILLALSLPLAAQPTISAFTCAANSPTSVKCSWTTSVAADSKITATGTGGPYNTPVVHPFGVGTGWGVTAHSIAITGLPNNVSATAYSLTATSCTAGGCNTSSAVTSGTTAPLASQTFHLVPAGPMFRPNDQLDGRNGTQNTGYAFHGDTGFFTWADDGFDYRTCEDCYAVDPGYYARQHIVKEALGHTSNVDLFTSGSQYLTGGGCPSASCMGSQGIISVRGSMYHQLSGLASGGTLAPVSITGGCTWTTGTTTCLLTNSGTPTMTTGIYVDIVSVSPSTYNFHGLLTGANSTSISYPIASNPGSYVSGGTAQYFLGCCATIYKTNDHWATQIAAENNTGPAVTGTHGQSGSAWKTIHPAGVDVLLSPVNCDGKDYACTPVAGLDGWVYYAVVAMKDWISPCGNGAGTNRYCFVRIRIEDMQITGPTTYWFDHLQWYKGTQTGDDGLYDVNWATSWLDPSIRVFTGIPPFTASWLASSLQQYNMTFVGDPFNRFVLSSITHPCGAGASCSNGGTIYDLGQYPWASTGVPTLVGGFTRDVQKFPYSMPGFTQPVMSTYAKIDGSRAYLRWQGSGMGIMGILGSSGVPPTWGADNYTTWLRDYIMTAGAPTVAPTDLPGSPDLDYQFDSYTGDTLIHDHSGNGHNVTDDNGHPYAFDDLGMWLYGFPTSNTSNPVYGTQLHTSSTTLTGFAPTYTTMTAYVCFGHVPGPPISAIASGEVVLGGHFAVARHLSTATWDVSFNGTLIGAVPIADGKIGCIAVRRDASNVVTVFGDYALRLGAALVPTAGPTTVTGTWTATNPVIGSGSNSLLGIYSRLAFFSTAKTDAQMITDMEIIRGDLRKRGVQIQ